MSVKSVSLWIEFFTCNPPRCWRNRVVSNAKKHRNNRRIRLPFFSFLFFTVSINERARSFSVADTKSWEISRGFSGRSQKRTAADWIIEVSTAEIPSRFCVLLQYVNLFSGAIDSCFTLAFLENPTRISRWRSSHPSAMTATRVLFSRLNLKMQEWKSYEIFCGTINLHVFKNFSKN